MKQKRLPDGLQNLAERIGLSSRYYLKSVTGCATTPLDEVLAGLAKEAQVSLASMSSVAELAVQLTLDDFAVYAQVRFYGFFLYRRFVILSFIR